MPFNQDAYWIDRHRQFPGDLRAVANLGKTAEENEAGTCSIRRSIAATLHTLSATGAVLEIGCGFGRLAPAFCDAGLAYTGLDVSPDAISAARLIEPRGRYIAGSALSAAWGGPYDMVAACYVLVHFVDNKDWRAVLHRITETMKTDGILLLADEFPPVERFPAPHVRHRTLATYAAELGRLGMRLDTEFREMMRGRISDHIHIARFD